jgi:hypothetical protein
VGEISEFLGPTARAADASLSIKKKVNKKRCCGWGPKKSLISPIWLTGPHLEDAANCH